METTQSGNTSFQEQSPTQNPGGNRQSDWLNYDEIDTLRSRWSSIQAQFVEDSRTAVEQGDTLVAETLQRISQMISEQHNNLNQKCTDSRDLSTEDLQITLQDYRSLFNRLLAL